jgi:hypothetical protein
MSKKYDIPEIRPQMTNEPAVAYPVKPMPLHLDITLEDNAMVADIKKAIQMIKGISSVKVVNAVKKKAISSDPFAELDTTWGGDRDANDIAEELHAMRSDTRVIETW